MSSSSQESLISRGEIIPISRAQSSSEMKKPSGIEALPKVDDGDLQSFLSRTMLRKDGKWSVKISKCRKPKERL